MAGRQRMGGCGDGGGSECKMGRGRDRRWLNDGERIHWATFQSAFVPRAAQPRTQPRTRSSLTANASLSILLSYIVTGIRFVVRASTIGSARSVSFGLNILFAGPAATHKKFAKNSHLRLVRFQSLGHNPVWTQHRLHPFVSFWVVVPFRPFSLLLLVNFVSWNFYWYVPDL